MPLVTPPAQSKVQLGLTDLSAGSKELLVSWKLTFNDVNASGGHHSGESDFNSQTGLGFMLPRLAVSSLCFQAILFSLAGAGGCGILTPVLLR